MTQLTVSTSVALINAAKSAKDGDIILVQAGNYSNVRLSNLNFANGVTIASQDPIHQAVFSDFLLTKSSGVTIKNIEMATAIDTRQLFVVSNSTDIHLDKLNIHGTIGLGSSSVSGALFIRDSTGVTVTNSEFHDMQAGLSLLNTTNVTVSGNYFHAIQIDGIHGGGNSNLSVLQNAFSDFTPAVGDHADAIQLWTTNTTASAHDITIADNVIQRGSGQAIQGILISDQVGNLPYQNVTVTRNLVLGESYRSISVSHANGLEISSNEVLGYSDREARITVDSSTHSTITDNVTTKLSIATSVVDQQRNVLAAPVQDGGAAALTSWLASHPGFSGAWGTSAAFASSHGLGNAALTDLVAPVHQYVDVIGTAADDRLYAVAGLDSRLAGGDGNDQLLGSANTHNLLIGGNGDDVYSVKGVGDVVIEQAGGGIDRVHAWIDYTLPDNVENLRLVASDLTGVGNELANTIWGSTGDDKIYGMGGDDVIGGDDGNDQIWGGDGNDSIDGGNGADRIFGDAGNDILKGGSGNDFIDGGAGDDIIIGGPGADVMTGGAGADIFRFMAADLDNINVDTITDFSKGDKIDLKSIDANIFSAKDDAFTFIGTNDFHHVAGELHYSIHDGSAFVSGDTNGDGIADFTIMLSNVSSLQATDFIL